MFANGMRVLDQLGLSKEIEERNEPIVHSDMRDEHGHSFKHSNLLAEFVARHGYCINFMERKDLLAVMYDAQPNKSKLLSDKKVDHVEQTEKGVKVTTSDGSVYEGDIVIGADGVWSKIRQEMWNVMDADKNLPKDVAKSLAKDKKSLTCEYSCIFGISYNCDKMKAGNITTIFRPGSSFLIIAGREGTVYWFYFEKLDNKYTVPNIPRYTAEDAIKSAEKQLDAKITEDVTFGDLWKCRKSAIKVALEEGIFRRWHYGRFVVIGDAAHKMTPNMGQGGNSAIESVTILSNCLKRTLDKYPQGLNSQQVDECFKEFQAERRKRIKNVFNRAGDATRREAMDSLSKVMIGRYVIPRLGDKVHLKMLAKLMKEAPSLEFVDKPTRAHESSVH
ncbi:hypothetical protein BGW37DRAFT_466643 [Umbelopsis sp. PMI_123]|nr:hypothetical protein BGW37DRAFT_466643 [Umbelopsis sp. PMI_123]